MPPDLAFGDCRNERFGDSEVFRDHTQEHATVASSSNVENLSGRQLGKPIPFATGQQLWSHPSVVGRSTGVSLGMLTRSAGLSARDTVRLGHRTVALTACEPFGVAMRPTAALGCHVRAVVSLRSLEQVVKAYTSRVVTTVKRTRIGPSSIC